MTSLERIAECVVSHPHLPRPNKRRSPSQLGPKHRRKLRRACTHLPTSSETVCRNESRPIPVRQDRHRSSHSVAMGNCIARKKRTEGVELPTHPSTGHLPPLSPAVSSQSQEEPAARRAFVESITRSPKSTSKEAAGSGLTENDGMADNTSPSEQQQQQSSQSTGKHGTRRRLSLIHADPITHPSEEGPRGVAKVYNKKPPSLETKVSLDGALDEELGGTRLSVVGRPPQKAQGNFSPKTSIRRGVQTTSLQELGIGIVCRKGLKPESPNQDDFFFYHLEHLGLYGVFDGHGPYGHDIANFVQQNLPQFLYNHDNFESDPKECIRIAFSKTQDEIERGCERRRFDATLSGCTATVVVHDIRKDMLYVGHVGDSRAVIGRKTLQGDGSLEAANLTEDHKPTLAREKARIEAQGGEVKRLEGDIPHRVFLKDKLYPGLAMSRALGDLVAGSAGVSSEPEIAEWKIDRDRDEFLIICSDGVWEFISSDEAVHMVHAITKGNKAEVDVAAEKLARESWNRWIQEEGDVVDDITVEVIYLR